MRDKPSRDPARRSAGDVALAFGLAAVLCALIPGIGDVISAPTAAAAVICGFIGVGHYDAGRTPSVLSAAVGTALGALALFFIAVTFIATHAPA